jgi:hypothetical protein
LLRATSDLAFEILKDGAIKLPATADKDAVCRLVNHLENIIKFAPWPSKINSNVSMVAALSLCSAAKLLGIRKYVSHIYKKCEALLHHDPPTYDNITAIITCKDEHPRLYNIVLENLAILVYDQRITDPEAFAEYLSQQHPRPRCCH